MELPASSPLSSSSKIDGFLIPLDFAYALRYVAKTGRSQCPWSERRMGVYHKFDGATSVWVIMQPTPAALGLPKAASAPRWREIGPALPHVLLFQSSLPAWVAYLKYLEGIVRGNVWCPLLQHTHTPSSLGYITNAYINTEPRRPPGWEEDRPRSRILQRTGTTVPLRASLQHHRGTPIRYRNSARTPVSWLDISWAGRRHAASRACYMRLPISHKPEVGRGHAGSSQASLQSGMLLPINTHHLFRMNPAAQY